MNLRVLLLPLAGAIALLGAACVGGGDNIYVTSEGAQTGITSSGVGKAYGEPDVVVVNVGVQAERPTVEAAREAAAAAQQGVIDALKANGVADNDIQTVQFSVYPVYDFGPNRDQTIRGYQVSNVVTAKVRDINTIGRVLDDTIRAGGNDAVVQGISFTIDDPNELKRQAREQAVREAQEQARQLASAAGVRLGALISISESTDSIPFRDMAASAREMAQADTPIEAGELEITVRVNLLYAIDQ